MKKALAIAFFHLKVIVIKLLVVLVALPLGVVLTLFWMTRGESDIHDFMALFNPIEWSDTFEDTIEKFFGCRWFVCGARYGPALPPYAFWDYETKAFCCLWLEDAVMLNLKCGGTLSRKLKAPEN